MKLLDVLPESTHSEAYVRCCAARLALPHALQIDETAGMPQQGR
ncbi:hypothetical protein GbCGDNIH2_0978 [Granulibacter bethesdensis]|uniref:Uncharacterized protein n=2 Tax=Granulibacter bethesdensis TaxID=364410 RepID=Q0BTH6_GRABC|nr:hypothetical protein GbCGDNIH1_0978 [Granulibacter bethesdensis CGDNIH1]APG30446.1 hypothetical protein GbCGDNIH3_0978 [Granulibacter bethesdensis]APG30608.1 hypothetical protein GbCGDNIH2_0978 [Granulibacter bethesdensis]APH51689.1 hypothetical protein GbCGDNIH5_0978 [Granulibacter bethesdensis]APH64382.1 hypothetical protein GbCGDNIH1I4_0978 [Granulibacter bethesdensis]